MATDKAAKRKKRRKKESQQHKLHRILLALTVFFVILIVDKTRALNSTFGERNGELASSYTSFRF